MGVYNWNNTTENQKNEHFRIEAAISQKASKMIIYIYEMPKRVGSPVRKE
jgi:hypothetical protein